MNKIKLKYMLNLSKLTKKSAVILAVVLGLAVSLPAQAFYLFNKNVSCTVLGFKLPGSCADYLPFLAAGNQTSQGRVLSEETSTPPPGDYNPPPGGGQGRGPDSGYNYPPPPPDYNRPGGPNPVGESNTQLSPQPTSSCQPPDCVDRPSTDQYGPNDEQRQQMDQQNQQRQLEGMKRGIKQMERSIKEFERMVQTSEKKGITVSAELKDKLAKAKAIVSSIQQVSDPSELQNIGMDDLQDIMQSLEESRRDFFNRGQRMSDIKRSIRGMESGVKMFEKQVAQLIKSKIAVPATITDSLQKVKDIITKVKAAATTDALEAAGVDDLPEIMQTLDEQRQQLEILSRWPQTKKQLDRQINTLTASLKRAKSMVTRLAAKGIDVGTIYNEFEAAVNKLKSIRDEAVAKISEGQSEEAFQLLENDFFGQMDDIMENQRIIEMMNNFSRFTSRFKQEYSAAQRQIKALKKQKIDTSELESLLAQAKDKGDEIQALLKAKPVDTEVVVSTMEDFENIVQDFKNQLGELTGETEVMPWEQGTSKFQSLQLPNNLQGLLGKGGMGSIKMSPVGESNPQPSPNPKVCVPPDCTD